MVSDPFFSPNDPIGSPNSKPESAVKQGYPQRSLISEVSDENGLAYELAIVIKIAV